MRKLTIIVCAICGLLYGCAEGYRESLAPSIQPHRMRTLADRPEAATGNRCPVITNVSLSDESIRGGEQVRVAVTASDPDGDALYYFWTIYYGTLTGQSSQVIWTAPECDPREHSTRRYDIRVEASDGSCPADQVFAIAVICGSGVSGQAAGRLPASTILFAAGSTRVDNIAKAELDALAAQLKQFPDMAIRLEGHTDATGTDAGNQKIGLQRAESVKHYLITRHGLDANRIRTTSAGSQRPVASNDTAAGRAQNRRVEVYHDF